MIVRTRDCYIPVMHYQCMTTNGKTEHAHLHPVDLAELLLGEYVPLQEWAPGHCWSGSQVALKTRPLQSRKEQTINVLINVSGLTQVNSIQYSTLRATHVHSYRAH